VQVAPGQSQKKVPVSGVEVPLIFLEKGRLRVAKIFAHLAFRGAGLK